MSAQLFFEITPAIARKVIEVVDAGLVSGMGEPVPGQMCVEAAVCYAMGLPHGDQPACVAPALRALKIQLNDSRWSSDQARAKGLRRLAVAQLGSAGVLDEREFSRRIVLLAWRGNAPQTLKAVAALFRDGTATKERLLNAADILDRDEPNAVNAARLRKIRYDLWHGVAAADAVAAAVADAAAAAAAAAKEKFWNAYWRARNSVSEKKDAALAAFCEGVVQILIDMKAPGCQWLVLTEEAE